jgi:hypothetical protein
MVGLVLASGFWFEGVIFGGGNGRFASCDRESGGRCV